MNLLDEVQEELRDPRQSNCVSRAGETGLRSEYWYVMRGFLGLKQVERAYDWLRSREAADALNVHRGECVLVSGESIVGYGHTWPEAKQMARAQEVDIRTCVRVFEEETPRTLF